MGELRDVHSKSNNAVVGTGIDLCVHTITTLCNLYSALAVKEADMRTCCTTNTDVAPVMSATGRCPTACRDWNAN